MSNTLDFLPKVHRKESSLFLFKIAYKSNSDT
jgi:hypothetical protein